MSKVVYCHKPTACFCASYQPGEVCGYTGECSAQWPSSFQLTTQQTPTAYEFTITLAGWPLMRETPAPAAPVAPGRDGWQPVTDYQHVPIAQPVLVYLVDENGERWMTVGWRDCSGHWWMRAGNDFPGYHQVDGVTHWRPLPSQEQAP